jgi:hypothetical protein
VGYRARHELSQPELAGRLGMKQPQVARLELASTLIRTELAGIRRIDMMSCDAIR